MDIANRFGVDRSRQPWKILNYGDEVQIPAGPTATRTVREVLLERFRGMSVSVVYPRPSGVSGLVFVDVPVKGDTIRESYGDFNVVNFACLP